MKLGDRTFFGSHGNDLLVANALIWAAVIAAASWSAAESQLQDEFLPMLALAAFGSLLVLGQFVKHIHQSSKR